MSRQQVLQAGIAVVLVMLFLVGCGGSTPTAVLEAPAATSAPEQAATPTPEAPTATPVPPTATPIPPTPEPPTPTPSGPKAGNWEGSEPSVSFEVSSDGHNRNLKMVVSMVQGECTLEIEEIPIEEDGTFEFVGLVVQQRSIVG